MSDSFQAKANKIFADIWRDLEQQRMRNEADRAKADPVKHRLTTIFPKGASYSYCTAGKDGLGRTIWFCRSNHPNAAGYFLIWRQVRTKKHTTRDQWDSTTSKKAAIRIVRELARAHIQKHKEAA